MAEQNEKPPWRPTDPSNGPPVAKELDEVAPTTRPATKQKFPTVFEQGPWSHTNRKGQMDFSS